MKLSFIASAIAFVLLFQAEHLHAEISAQYLDFKSKGMDSTFLDYTLGVLITGEISDADYKKLIQIEKNYKKSKAWIVWLDSTGGSVESSINIGRILRKHSARLTIGPEQVCMSSCVFLIAGCVTRTLLGKVGIHRPYNPNDQEGSIEGQKNKQNMLGEIITKYLDEMNISKTLYEEMLHVSPGEIKILSNDDLDRFGLSRSDPYWEEASDIQNAKKFGLTRQEYIERNALIEKKCIQNPNLTDGEKLECAMEVMLGGRKDVQK